MFCCWIAFELIYCYTFIIETKGLTLEETAVLFDGEVAMNQIEHQAAQMSGTADVTDVREDAEKNSTSSSHEIEHLKV